MGSEGELRDRENG